MLRCLVTTPVAGGAANMYVRGLDFQSLRRINGCERHSPSDGPLANLAITEVTTL